MTFNIDFFFFFQLPSLGTFNEQVGGVLQSRGFKSSAIGRRVIEDLDLEGTKILRHVRKQTHNDMA